MKEVVEGLVDFIMSSNYAHAILILLAFVLGARLVLYFFKHVLEKLVHHSKVDDSIVIRMETPVVVIMVLLGIQLSARKILTDGLLFENFINSIIIIIVTMMFIGISNILITFWSTNRHNKENEEFHQEVQPLVKSLSKIVLAAVGVIAILQMWGVQVATTLASLGILGVVLGFVFQDTMKNIFGGISLIVDDSIHKKDYIRLESGEIGEVVEVNLRSTKMRTFDNEYLIVPNGLLSNSKIVNLAEPTPTLRIDIPVSVAYGNDPEEVRQVLLSSLKGNEEVLKFPKRDVRFKKLGEYSMDFMLLFYISDFRNKIRMEHVATTAAYNALRENNITIPFPTRTLYTGGPMKWKTSSKKVVKKKATKKRAKKRK